MSRKPKRVVGRSWVLRIDGRQFVGKDKAQFTISEIGPRKHGTNLFGETHRIANFNVGIEGRLTVWRLLGPGNAGRGS